MTPYHEARRLAKVAADELFAELRSTVAEFEAAIVAHINAKAVDGWIRVADARLDAPRELLSLIEAKLERLPEVLAAAVPHDTENATAVRRAFADVGRKLANAHVSGLRQRLEHGTGRN